MCDDAGQSKCDTFSFVNVNAGDSWLFRRGFPDHASQSRETFETYSDFVGSCLSDVVHEMRSFPSNTFEFTWTK
jgi:hypothetical protein